MSHPGLARVAAAHAAGNITGACNELALYYAAADTAEWLRVAAPRAPGTARVGGEADAVMLRDTYSFSKEVGRVPRSRDGGLDWAFTGPDNDREFCYDLNRHVVWHDWTQEGDPGFLTAWQQTGNPEYPSAFDARVLDWVTHNLPGPAARAQGPAASHKAAASARAGSPGGCTWRTIEAGIRTGNTWPTAFFGFQQSPRFKASSRCAMVAAFAVHGQFLFTHGTQGNANWVSMQLNGLGTLGLTMPELNGAARWYALAEDGILKDAVAGVYPDGVETEQTSNYEVVALNSFDNLFEVARQSGRAPAPQMAEIIERMYNYVAYSTDPAGISARNGDSDTTNNVDNVLYGANVFNRSDWVYIVTNGANGTAPAGPPSAMFEWAGQFISRSGWGAGAQWSWFDVGPFGSSSHAHYDKLHLSVRVGPVKLLVDSGRFAYSGVNLPYQENYGKITRGHNVLLLDGKEQVSTPATAKGPVPNHTWSISPDQDRARGTITFTGLTGVGSHTRSIVYQRGEFWVVVDRVATDRPRSVEALWHAHPNCTVTAPRSPAVMPVARLVDNATKVGLDVVVASGGATANWSGVELIIGQHVPVLQGWYASSMHVFGPSPVLSFTAHVSAGNSTFAWLLLPTAHGRARRANATVRSANATHAVVDVGVDDSAVTTFVVAL